MKYNIKASLIVFLVFLIIFLLLNNNLANLFKVEDSQEQKQNLINSVKINEAVLNVELAVSNAERTMGLSNRTSLKPDEGMLFVFNNSGKYPFWMKDMNFPIDIIWIDENQKVVLFEKDAKPESFPNLLGGTVEAIYVLETVSGFVDKNNIKIGDTVEFF
ncbi:MAG: DUF192 domain-containing protein [Candidatus Paceibacterota bacterium]